MANLHLLEGEDEGGPSWKRGSAHKNLTIDTSQPAV